MRYSIEYEFELNLPDSKIATQSDIVDCIKEDVESAIEKAILNITPNTTSVVFRIKPVSD